jgi:mannose/fructose/N-acetylgalactosamine-specific phosphotransferase system component IIB
MHLYRIDNRLVHGQIISTWMPHLRLKRFVVINDALPTSQLRMKMFRMAIPAAVDFHAFTVSQAADWFDETEQNDISTLVLFESIDDAVRLFEAGHPFTNLNLGNVHHGPGRRSFTPSVFLSDDDLSKLKSLFARGVRCEIRSLPTQDALDLSPLLSVA